MTTTTSKTLFDVEPDYGDINADRQLIAESSDNTQASSPTAGDPDELEMPDGLRDGDCPLPDDWRGLQDADEELDDVAREAELFPDADAAGNRAKEPPQEGAAPATPSVGRRVDVAVQATGLWEHALGNQEQVPPSIIEARAAEIRAMGQIRACRGRILPDGHVQIVAGMLDWLAVRHIAAENGEPWTVIVEVEEMTDETAFKVAYGEAAEGVPLAPIDRAKFVREAIATTFKTQRAMAERLGLHESNVSRLLAVGRCADIVGDRVTDPWTISCARSERFMRLHADPAQKKPLLAFLKAAEPQKARALFAAVFASFDPQTKATPGEVVVTDDRGGDLGRMARTRDGEVVIRLDKSTGAIEPATLLRFVENALCELRSRAA